MTYKERQQAICKECCIHDERCAYFTRNMQDDCPKITSRMVGWELGYQDAVDKVCELIFEYNKRQARKFGAKSMMRLPDYTINVRDFRKAMEERQ